MKPTFTNLNPSAPEYHPIPPGVTPHPNAPLPSFLSPPPAAPSQQPCPPQPLPPPLPSFLPSRFFTYTPTVTSQSTPQPSYANYYYVIPQDPFITTRNPPPPPPPRRPQGRTVTAQRRRVPAVSASTNKAEKKGRGFSDNLKYEKTPVINSCNKALTNRSMHHRNGRKGDHHNHHHHHQVMPLNKDEEKTTVMIKNIPYDCPRKELLSLIDVFCLMENVKARNEDTSAEESFSSAYDFLYLPIDFRTKKSRGFAFVNFTNAAAVWKFFQAFHLKDWNFIHRKTLWSKKIEVVTAKIQGKEALVNHFSQSIFDCESDEFLPVTFDPPRDGSGQTGQLTAVGSRRSSSRH
ncbi:hypothetical protein OROMI_028232 [Orobanche minor]